MFHVAQLSFTLLACVSLCSQEVFSVLHERSVECVPERGVSHEVVVTDAVGSSRDGSDTLVSCSGGSSLASLGLLSSQSKNFSVSRYCLAWCV